MIRLQTFGSVDVRGSDGRAAGSLLSQPKRLALFVYLAVARPRGFHRRDHVLALFWPDADDIRARASLNQALSFLRRELGEAAIASRGADAIGIAEHGVTSDVMEFEQAMDDRRWSSALDLCSGPFLQALHVDDAPGVVEWADRERERLNAAAVQAGMNLANDHRDRGNVAAALSAVRRAREFAPLDELALRLELLIAAESGNRAAAAMTFDDYRERLARELGVEPSSRTRALVESIKDGSFSANLRRAPGVG